MTDQTLRDRLKEGIDRVSIKPLIPHYERQALWLVSAEIELLDVGVAVANDDSERVASWIRAEKLRQPSEQEIESWLKDVLAQHFEFLIVQPFVLTKVHSGGEANWRFMN